jgi:hypothetical protein
MADDSLTGPGQAGWESLLRDLAPVLRAATPYGADVVVAGGVVPLLYRYLPGCAAVRHPALLTTDIDLTIRSPRVAVGPPALDERLRQADFVEVFSCATDPALGRFQHRRYGDADLGPVYIEFLTPQVGAARRRDGRDQRVVRCAAGVTAQALPYLHLLFIEPLRLDPGRAEWLAPDTSVSVPHPATFVVAKLLVLHRRREPAARAKDAAYVFDVVALMRNRWSELAEVWRRLRDSGACPPPWLRTARQVLADQFGAPVADGVIATRAVYVDLLGPGRAPSESAIAAAVAGFIACLDQALAR